MATSLNALGIRRALREHDTQPNRSWKAPTEFGADGWRLLAYDGPTLVAEVIATVADFDIASVHDGGYADVSTVEIAHASIAVLARMPSYEEMVLLHRAVFGEQRWAYQVFAPAARHVNIHEGALHLWGRLDGKPMMFDFSSVTGTI
ncbi:MAG TPA: hypothetical protein VMT27_07735 [Actinomycetes bacterium]|nr:hypothetical protein [Actinomycetes bacterium]